MKSICILFISLFLLIKQSYATLSKTTIYFEKSSASIEMNEKQKLDALKYAGIVMLCGHTDGDGSPGSNYILSEKRVLSIKAYLVKMGLPEYRIRIDYKGEKEPLNQNMTENEKALNRRVEIIYNDDPLLQMQVHPQKFKIQSSRDTTILLEEGTRVYIEAGTFEAPLVDVTIREFVKTTSILAENLSTRAGNRNLQTAGMVYIDARNGSQVAIPQKPIEYTFQNPSKQNDFQYFEGNEKEDLSIDWVAESDYSPLPAKPEWKDSNSMAYRIFINGMHTYDLDKSMKPLYKQLASKINEDALLSLIEDTTIFVTIKVNTKGNIYSINDNNLESCSKNRIYSLLLNNLPRVFPGKNSSYESEIKMNIHINPFVQLFEKNTYSDLAPKTIDSIYKEHKREYLIEQAIISTNNLGWINCDRFIDDTRKKIAFAVKADRSTNIKMIMPKQRAFFNPHLKENKNDVCYFSNTPLNEPIILIATKRVGDKISLAIAKTTTSEVPFTGFEYKEVSEEEMISTLEALNI